MVTIEEIRSTYTCRVCGATPCAFVVDGFEQLLEDPRLPSADTVRTRGLPREALGLLEHRAHGRSPPDGEGMGGILSLREIRTEYECSQCGQVGCRPLMAILDRMLEDPDVAPRIYAEPEGLTRRSLEQMADTAHGADGGHGAGQGDGGAPTQQRAALPEHAPWHVESLRSEFGTRRIEELAEKVNEPDEKRRLMALMKANGDVDTAAALLESEGEARAQEIGVGGGSGGQKTPEGVASPALCQAVVTGNHSEVERILGEAGDGCGATWKFATDEGSVTIDDDWDLLRVAAVEGHTAVCQILVQHGAEADRQQTATGRTPLYNAAWAGQVGTVQFLHEQCDADLGCADSSGSTPLWAAAAAGHPSVVSYLVQHAAELSTPERRTKALSLVAMILKNLAKDPDNLKYKTLRRTNPRVRTIMLTGLEYLLKAAGFTRDPSSEEMLVISSDVNPQEISRLQAVVAQLQQRTQPQEGLVHGAPLGARVIRGPDWRWGNQDGGEGREGTVVGSRSKLEARVDWDRGRPNVYRTGNHGEFDLCYAPQSREAPEVAAKRLNQTGVMACFASARWWQDTPMSEAMRTLDGTLKHDHPDTRCENCKVAPIRGVRYIYEGAEGSAPSDLCEACFEKLSSSKHSKERLTVAQRQKYSPVKHPALAVFQDNLQFCRAHELYDLADFLEFREKRTLVRAKQRLRWAQGLLSAAKDATEESGLWDSLDVDCVARVADWLSRGAVPGDVFVLRVLEEEAGDGTRAHRLAQLNLQLRPEMRVIEAWLSESHLPTKLLRHVGAGCLDSKQQLFDKANITIEDQVEDDVEAAASEDSQDVPCATCGAALQQYQKPDEDYACDQCGACPTLYYCTAGCEYELCQRCFDRALDATDDSTDMDDVEPSSEEGAPCTRAVQMFERNLIEFRRVRQLADPRRTARTAPQFTSGGVHTERSIVQSTMFPRWTQDQWDVSGGILLIWAGVTDIDELCQGIDADSKALMKLILHADDHEYLQRHRQMCKVRRVGWFDRDYEESGDFGAGTPESETPEPEPEPEETGAQPKTTVEVVADLFAFARSMSQNERPPDQVKDLEWARFQRCADALPHQAPQLDTQQLVGTEAAAASAAAEPPSLRDFLTSAKLLDYAQALEALGMVLQDVPFTTQAHLVSTIDKEGHQKRFLRHAKKLPVLKQCLNKYDKEWIQRTTERLVPDLISVDVVRQLHWLQDEKFRAMDLEFQSNIGAYRRIRQLVDPAYAMSTAARTRCQGRLCGGGFHAERQFVRENLGDTAHWMGGVGGAVEKMWAGESLLPALVEGINDDARLTAAEKRRLVQLIWNSESREFDDDIRVHEMIGFEADSDRVERKFHSDM